MSNSDKLKDLYKQANSLNETLPGDLMKKLTLYGKILELLGGFHAQSVKAWKLAEATRREAIASAYTYSDGSIADKTNQAEVAAAKSRREEAEAEAEATRWKNAYISTQEQIQIMKLQLKDMKEVASGGV
ncbi:hypothetical protein HMPREF3291_05245 [Bacillus sp. HMSC76G11]|nr:hypothetical protein HMPREF3291_05245 [Bacillus sp. HMSC76G11]